MGNYMGNKFKEKESF